MGSTAIPKGCLLVGSVPLDNAEEVFHTCLDKMPNRLQRIPDGETGERHYFARWQYTVLKDWAPKVIAPFGSEFGKLVHSEFTSEEVEEELGKARAQDLETGYDFVALDSYKTFKKLKNQGAIPAHVKFQVSLPTSTNVVAFAQKALQPGFQPIYEKALFKALRNIQDNIPHDELAIQLDLAIDTLIWHNPSFGWWKESETKAGTISAVVRMMQQVDHDVDLGIHNCYGDAEHKHFLEPNSLADVVERAQGIFSHNAHPFKWFHVPVPLSAMDKLEAYLAPLKDLFPRFKADGTELYLGLVHFNDLEGTKKRIEVAKKVLGDVEFGIATECGWGRTPRKEIENIMSISTEVSKPVI